MFNNLHFCFHCKYQGKALKAPKTEITPPTDFDLTDKHKGTAVTEMANGEASFMNSGGVHFNVIHIDTFLQQIINRDFMKCHNRVCDYLIVSPEDSADSVIGLAELTMADSLDNFEKPIVDKKNGNVIFPKGKSDKGPVQLASTLKALSEIDCIANEFKKYNRRFCAFFYRLNEDSKKFSAVNAFSRGASVIASATSGEGAKLSNPEINDLGFDFYRVQYPTQFRI